MSDTTTCPSCSATLPAGAAFCTTCGTKIDAPVAADAPPPPSVDDTRVDNPGLSDATQVYTPPAPEPVAAPPAAAPWQPADTGTPPPLADPPAWSPPAEAAPPPPTWEPPAPPVAPPNQWGAPGAPGQMGVAGGFAGGPGAPGAPGAPPIGGPPPAWNQPAAPPAWGAAPAPVAASSSSGGGSPLGGILAIVGALLAFAGLFSPWIGTNISNSTITGWKLAAKDSGFDTKDPYLLLVLAILAVVIGVLIFTGKARTPVRIVAVIVGLAIIGTHVRDWMDIADIAKGFQSTVKITAKYGFYLGFVGAGLLIIGAFMPGKKTA